MGFGTRQADITSILQKTKNLPAAPADQSVVLAIEAAVGLVKNKTDNLPPSPADELTSLDIKGMTDNLPASPADQVKISKLTPSIDLWSSISPQVQLTTAAGDKSLPSIVIAGLPSSVSIARAVMMVVFRTMENTNAAQNYVSGAQVIQAQKAVSGSWITALSFAGGELDVPASTRESGSVLMGMTDISSQIPANGATINFQWASALAAQNNLNINDIQLGIRIWFTT